jgi:hypothetical protein
LYRYFVSQSSEFPAITLCVTSQRVFIVVVVVVVYFVIDSVRKLLDTPSYFVLRRFGGGEDTNRYFLSSCAV